MFESRHKSGYFKIFLTVLLTAVGTGILFLFAFTYFPRNITPSPSPGSEISSQTPVPQQLVADATGVPGGVTNVAKAAMPGVVGISVLKVNGDSIFDRNTTEKWGLGSGIIVTSNGYILTNNHVAGGKNKRIIVSLADGRNVDGETVWSDPVLDLAIVKINATGLTTIPIGDATKLQVGEPAIAIGNPLGLQFQRTVTSGIISALNRTIRIDTDQGTNYMEDLIQTDASINPGNSGGPLLNSSGQVVGINTIKVASAEAMGFAVPINVVVPIIQKYIDGKDFKEPYMGIFAYDKEVMPYVGNGVKLDKGIYVANIDENGPAYKSGIRLGCVITQVDGMDIETMLQLRTYLYSKKPGDTINVTHISNGKTETIPVVLAEKTRDGMVTR